MRIAPINTKYADSNVQFGQTRSQGLIKKFAKNTLIPVLGLLGSYCGLNAQNLQPLHEDVFTKTEAVKYSKDLILNNQHYTMFYSDDGFSEDKNDKAVADIYFQPKNEKLPTYKLEKLMLHKAKTVDEDVLIGVLVEYRESPKDTPQRPPQEIKFTKDIAEILLDLYQGNSEFYLIPGSNTYSEYNIIY